MFFFTSEISDKFITFAEFIGKTVFFKFAGFRLKTAYIICNLVI